MVLWGEGKSYGTLGKREEVTMVLWEKGRADYGTLGRKEGLTMVLWGEGKG